MSGGLVGDVVDEFYWIRMEVPARWPTEHRFTDLSRS
jgi:hypothetical protein